MGNIEYESSMWEKINLCHGRKVSHWKSMIKPDFCIYARRCFGIHSRGCIYFRAVFSCLFYCPSIPTFSAAPLEVIIQSHCRAVAIHNQE